ncbi:MAG: hypothetical protein CM15mP74_19780 [Halieaceae bacterium]|nr:MAG: hypothetical protein CM15mP74_19780 [Halieaceae bacterium]
MPLLMAKRALRDVPSGGVLVVLSTDAGSERDFESFARLADTLCVVSVPGTSCN